MFTATIGFFDGVHKGHQCLIEQLRKAAALHGERTMVVSFNNHPREVVQPAFCPQLLTLSEEKETLLGATGIDEIKMLEFTPAMSRLSAMEFMTMMRDEWGVKTLLMGYDHHFGHDGGTFSDYTERGKRLGIEVLAAQELEGLKVSSRRIRQALLDGDVSHATEMLAHPFRVTAPVERGFQVGQQLGFPTANLVWPAHKLQPMRGVYAVKVMLDDGTVRKGMLNIGRRPTIGNGANTSTEVHLLDFAGDLYGQKLTIDFIARMRDEQHFDSRDALIEQLRRDAAMLVTMQL